MRALLILAVLLPLMVIVAWVAAQRILGSRRRRAHIEELERENRRLDELLDRARDPTGREP